MGGRMLVGGEAVNGCVVVLGLLGRSEGSGLSGVISGAGPRSGVMSDPGVSSEVG